MGEETGGRVKDHDFAGCFALMVLALVGLLATIAAAHDAVTTRGAQQLRGQWAEVCGTCIRIKDAKIDCSTVCERKEGR